MSTLELVLAIVTGLGALAWVGSVLTAKIQARNNIELKQLGQTNVKIDSLKKTITQQNAIIQTQNEQIANLQKKIEQMQIKLRIIIPVIEKHLSNTPENLELLKHLKDE